MGSRFKTKLHRTHLFQSCIKMKTSATLLFVVLPTILGANINSQHHESSITDTLPGGVCEGTTTLYWSEYGFAHSRSFNQDQAMIGRVGPQARAVNTGNCCWKFHRRPVFRGRGFALGLGETRTIPFAVRSVKKVDCIGY